MGYDRSGGGRHGRVVARVEMTFGERAADWVAANIGRWAFVIGQTVIISAWIWYGGPGHSDPFPYILLNLALSLQAAYTGPVLLISSNRADATRATVLEAVNRHTQLIEQHTDDMQKHASETHRAILEMRHDHKAMMARLEAAANG